MTVKIGYPEFINGRIVVTIYPLGNESSTVSQEAFIQAYRYCVGCSGSSEAYRYCVGCSGQGCGRCTCAGDLRRSPAKVTCLQLSNANRAAGRWFLQVTCR